MSSINSESAREVIKISNLSKDYILWSSPRARLAYLMDRLSTFFFPFGARRRNIELKSREYFKVFNALSDVSFSIKKGESWGFIGVNGSGKSTLLKIISGNITPSGGSVEVDGKVTILDYGSGFNAEFTGKENIYIKGNLFGLSKKEIDKKLDSIEKFADIGEFINQPVKTYSSGMIARLGFAIISHIDADIIITDEALAVGDAFFVQKCMRYIRNFLNKGTFLFVSHSVNDVMNLCDHAVWLQHGKVMKIGLARDVCNAYTSSIEAKNSKLHFEEKEDFKDDQKPQLIKFNADTLANLKNYYAPKRESSSINNSKIQSYIKISKFEENLQSLINGTEGVGGGYFFDVSVLNEEGEKIDSVLGGEVVCLKMHVVAESKISSPIVGFQLKNSLGLPILAENTSLLTQKDSISLEAGEVLTAHFKFLMPLLSAGEYMLRVGLADGVETNNSLVAVMHEALLITCKTTGSRHGIVGVPMIEVGLHKVQLNAA